MKNLALSVLCLLGGIDAVAESYYATDNDPYAPAAGQAGSTAIHKDDSAFAAWADGYENYLAGTHLAPQWMVPSKALGKAEGEIGQVVSLGRGGAITLTFSGGISDGPGADFAVFENAFEDTFLELSFVEVSSDGTNFVRFPNYSWSDATAAENQEVNPILITGFAGKYRQAYGTPFDLDDLRRAYDAQLAGNTDFTSSFAAALVNTYPLLDTSHVTHVRLIDVVGDGTATDAGGYIVYDPYPTVASAGFDLDAIGVIHQPAPNGVVQSIAFNPIPHQKLAFGSVALDAVADSGLPVSYAVQSGPATVVGNLLTFMVTGIVEVVASQPGNATYAPAAPVLRSFRVAEEIQHVFIEPIPNQIAGSAAVELNAYSSSGLPVGMEVYSGPPSTLVDVSTHELTVGSEPGAVTLRAYQVGTASIAPAEDRFFSFTIVNAGAAGAPLDFNHWSALFNIADDVQLDSDGDGARSLQEFAMGTNPTNAASVPVFQQHPSTNIYNQPAIRLRFEVCQDALARIEVQHSMNLESWSNTVPHIVSTSYTNRKGTAFVEMALDLPTASPNEFFRLFFRKQ